MYYVSVDHQSGRAVAAAITLGPIKISGYDDVQIMDMCMQEQDSYWSVGKNRTWCLSILLAY